MGSRVAVLAVVVGVGAGGAGCRQIFGIDDTVAAGGDAGAGADGNSIDAASSCSDLMLSPGEADIDCGGTCPNGCAAGDDCGGHGDCASSVCASNVCVLLTSCLAIRDAGQVTSGVYPVDIDGVGASVPFDVYCDQTREEGGWTLVMTLSSADTSLAYDAPYWETTLTLDENVLAPNTTLPGWSSKPAAYNLVVGSELRLEWRDPADHSFFYAIPTPTLATALAVFQSGEDLVVGDETNACHGPLLAASPSFLAERMRHGSASQFFGINGEDGAERMRFGFASNDEPASEWNAHQGAGTTGDSLVWKAHNDCNNCACFGEAYEPPATAANLWIR